MKFSSFQKIFSPSIIFSLNDIKKYDPSFLRVQLSQWQKQDLITKIIKTKYTFHEENMNEAFLFLVANQIYEPSYISFESALSHHGLIPEGVYSITSATSRHARIFETAIGRFAYTSIKKNLIFGYELIPYKNRFIKMASAEKALLDYLYIHANLNSPEAIQELRINPFTFQEVVSKEKMEKYLKKYQNKALEKRFSIFIKELTYAGH